VGLRKYELINGPLPVREAAKGGKDLAFDILDMQITLPSPNFCPIA
jgi:hypothetical protein